VGSSRRAVEDPVAGAPTGTTLALGPTTTLERAVNPTQGTAPTRTTATITAPKGMGRISVTALPVEARLTLELIDAGGPFPYRQDGATFQNRERLLPTKPSGYYREYTVETPGEDDRGARRIVAGEDGERYYTSDHYESFRLVVP
jgi:ribonuclease T1